MKQSSLIVILISIIVLVVLAFRDFGNEQSIENRYFSANSVQEQEQVIKPQPTLIGTRCPTASMSDFGLALFNAINNERIQAGISVLGAYGCAVYVAQLRSDDLASLNYFAHTSPNGDTAFLLLDANRVPHGWAGENLARNNYHDDQTVAVAISDLMVSEGHRANILKAALLTWTSQWLSTGQV
ncbi:hypothetical protein IH779_02820 [Patescibacteria group bacterium]|nr:hypothetical protein [Patescibacteria group bacterium]